MFPGGDEFALVLRDRKAVALLRKRLEETCLAAATDKSPGWMGVVFRRNRLPERQ